MVIRDKRGKPKPKIPLTLWPKVRFDVVTMPSSVLESEEGSEVLDAYQERVHRLKGLLT